MCRDGGGRWVSPQGFALHQLEPLLLTWLQYPAHQETTLLATHLTPPIIITIVMVALDAGDDEMKQLLFSGQCKLFDQKQKTDIGANGSIRRGVAMVCHDPPFCRSKKHSQTSNPPLPPTQPLPILANDAQPHSDPPLLPRMQFTCLLGMPRPLEPTQHPHTSSTHN